MNEELTREVLEAMERCGGCPACGAYDFCSKHDWQEMIQSLATALLEERAKPKTRARQIIENPDCPFKSCQFWDDNADGKCGGELHGGSAQETCEWYTDYESALNKYAEELTKKETN